MEEIPLFPLGSVLFPGGRLPLRIFEQRYLDLVRRCMREDSGFGLVWISAGSEVAAPGAALPSLAERGCYARIIDWDSLPGGLLGITIEGARLFSLEHAAEAEPGGLVAGRVEYLPERPAEPVREAWASMVDVLASLQQHPHVQQLGIDPDHDDAWQVGNALAQLLPVDEAVKYELLAEESIDGFMERLDAVLNELGGLTA